MSEKEKKQTNMKLELKRVLCLSGMYLRQLHVEYDPIETPIT